MRTMLAVVFPPVRPPLSAGYSPKGDGANVSQYGRYSNTDRVLMSLLGAKMPLKDHAPPHMPAPQRHTLRRLVKVAGPLCPNAVPSNNPVQSSLPRSAETTAVASHTCVFTNTHTPHPRRGVSIVCTLYRPDYRIQVKCEAPGVYWRV